MNEVIPIAVEIPREWFSPEEAARILHKSPYTIREWCRTGRLAARKRACGRGHALAWEIHLSELAHYLDHGLRPVNVSANQSAVEQLPGSSRQTSQ